MSFAALVGDKLVYHNTVHSIFGGFSLLIPLFNDSQNAYVVILYQMDDCIVGGDELNEESSTCPIDVSLSQVLVHIIC